MAIRAADDASFCSVDHRAVLVHLQKGWILAVVGCADGSAYRQSRHALFPRIFRLAKAARKRNQARMTEHACLLTVLAAEFPFHA